MNPPEHIGLVAIGGAGWMGGANYIRNLAASLRAASPNTRVSFVVGEPLVNDWRDCEPRLLIATGEGFFRRLVTGARSLGKALRDAGVEFLYPLTYDNEYNLGLSWPISAQTGAARWAGWIPDFQHRYLPELFSAEEIRRRDESIARLVEEAPRMVLSSESAAEDFRKFFPAHAAKAQVFRFAAPPPIFTDDEVEAPERFFLVCNQFWKHKNHLVVFEALRILRDRGLHPVVLCTGQIEDYRDRDYASTIRQAVSPDVLGDQVRLLGLIPRHEQITLMRRALAIVQPSRFEGWSTVVEDARVLGRPTVLSDIPVHREQNPPGARFFPPDSSEALADVLAAAWNELASGPDEVAENLAIERAQTRLAMAGRRFLEIASA
jgi:glycosyltransferase involved in cell wall biosynthesis